MTTIQINSESVDVANTLLAVRPTADGGFVALYKAQKEVPINGVIGINTTLRVSLFSPDEKSGKLVKVGSDIPVGLANFNVMIEPTVVALPDGGFAVLQSEFDAPPTTVDFFDDIGSKEKTEVSNKFFVNPFGDVDLGFGDTQRFFGFHDQTTGDITVFDVKTGTFRPMPNTFPAPRFFDAGHVVDLGLNTGGRLEIFGTTKTRSGLTPSYDVAALGSFEFSATNPRILIAEGTAGNLVAAWDADGNSDNIFLFRPNEDGIGRKITFGPAKPTSILEVLEVPGVGFAAVIDQVINGKSVPRLQVYDMQGDLIARPKIKSLTDDDLFNGFGVIKLGDIEGIADMRLLLTGEKSTDSGQHLATGELFSFAVKLDNAGTKLDDALRGFGRDDKLRGLGGDDRLEGYDGDDTLKGDGGKDKLFGSGGDDLLEGGGGDDDLRGESGKDKLKGGDGDDKLNGGKGNDRLLGGKGNDKLDGEGGNDVLFGNDGRDRLTGRAGDDRLEGGGGGDDLIGSDGKDRLEGGDGLDTLFGSEGADVLIGGEGADELFGGKGADRFLFTSIKHSKVGVGQDEIADFSRKQNDKIVVRPIDANSKSSGNNKFNFIGSDDFSKKHGELRAEVFGSDTLVEGDVNGDGKADFSFFVIDVTNLNGGDFLL